MKAEDVKMGMDVRIVKHEKSLNQKGGNWISGREKEIGNTVTVTLIHKDDTYGVDGSQWWWTAECFEPVSGTTHEFKIGDSVRCIENMGQGQLNVGEIYEITGLQEKGDNIFVNGNTNCNAGFFTYRFEHVEQRKFKHGDTVRVIKLNPRHRVSQVWLGKVGIIDDDNPKSSRERGEHAVRIDKSSWNGYPPECLEHVDAKPNHQLLMGVDWAGEKEELVTISIFETIFGEDCQYYTVCNEENRKSKTYGPNKCDQCRDVGRYLRIKEVKYMEEETLNDICKQLNIEVVGKDSGSLILKDGRIGTIIQRKVTVTMTRAEKRAIISKLPDSVNNRAFIVEDSELSFSSYYFWDNEQPKEDVMPVETPE